VSTIKSSAENLTLNADGANNDIIFQSNGSNVATLDQAGLLTATTFAGSGASLTALPAAQLTGTLPAISGANLTGITAPNPNIIINGAMQVAQRSTSTVVVSGGSNEGFSTVDRWNCQFGGDPSGALTLSRDTAQYPAGFGHSLKIDCTTTGSASGNQTVYVKQPIEANDMRACGWEYTSTSSYITLSFWVRSSKTGTYCIALLDQDASDKMYTAEYTVSSANTWEKKSMSIPGHANLTFDDNVNLGLDVFFMFLNADLAGTANQWGSAAYGTSNQVNFLDSTSNVMYLTGVKLEVGNTATDYIHRSYDEELRLCQRYYQTYDAVQAQLSRQGQHSDFDGHVKGFFFSHPTMRATPTLSRANQYTWYGNNSSWTSTTNKWSVEALNNSMVGLGGSYDGSTGDSISQVKTDITLDAEVT